MTPAKYNLTIYKNRDFCKDFTFVDEDGKLIPIDNWVFKSQIRDTDCTDGTLLAEFTITVDPPTSTITMELTDLQTSKLPDAPAYWDLLVHMDKCDVSLIMGKVKVLCTVTEI